MTKDQSELTEEQRRQIKEMTDELNRIVQAINPNLAKNYSRIRAAYVQGYDVPELDPLRHEICLCITFGLNQAAITLTNHMLERLLKTALIYYETLRQPDNQETSEQPTAHAVINSLAAPKEKYAGNSLENNINAACTRGLITKEEKKQLKVIRDRLRDAFSHGDPDKTFGESETIVQALKFDEESGQVSMGGAESVPIASFLFSQGVHQVELARDCATDYFMYLDRLARKVFNRVYPTTREGDHEDPPRNQ